jgi:transposase-like protein
MVALRELPDRAPWRDAVAWAFARHHSDALGGAPIAAVCAELGLSRGTLFRWRREDECIGDLPAARVKRAAGTVVKGDTRAARAARKGTRPKGRPKKSTRENA